MPLTTWQWMWRGCSNQCRCHNKPDHCFMGNKSAPAVNILALAVTLFGAFCYLKTAPCVRRMTTLRTIHHIQIPTFAIRIIVMIHKISILRTHYSISRSSIFTSSSILVVKPLSGLGLCQSRNGPFRIIYRLFKATDFHWHFRVEICPTFRQL